MRLSDFGLLRGSRKKKKKRAIKTLVRAERERFVTKGSSHTPELLYPSHVLPEELCGSVFLIAEVLCVGKTSLETDSKCVEVRY